MPFVHHINPPSPEFLDLCDKMGLVVLDEAFDEWTKAKVDNGYHLYFDEWSKKDLSSLIMRDRNHPSVIMWSIGNEILEQSDKNKGFTVAKYLADICVSLILRVQVHAVQSLPCPIPQQYGAADRHCGNEL